MLTCRPSVTVGLSVHTFLIRADEVAEVSLRGWVFSQCEVLVFGLDCDVGVFEGRGLERGGGDWWVLLGGGLMASACCLHWWGLGRIHT